MTAAKHDPTDACADEHCYIHHVDEPGEGAYRICFECMHAYPTARHLRRDYRRAYWRHSGRTKWGPAERLWRRVWRVLTVRVSQITFCQHCIHDF